MPIRSFKNIPRNLVEWGKFFQSTEIIPDPGSVGEEEIENGSVTFQKLQNVTPDRLLGRDTSPAGQIQELTVTGGLEFTGSGIRRAALTGDVTVSAGDTVTTFRDFAACSVLGRSTNTSGAPTEIAAATNGHYLRRAANVVGFGAIADGDIPASIARDADVTSEIAASLAALNLASGAYTPTLTNASNLDASTAYVCQYMRVGTVVTVSGRVDVDPTAAGSTALGISLPVASAFSTGNDCGGTAFSPVIAGQGAAIYADATNDRALMEWIAVDTSNRHMNFTFTYRII
jgi:hypothetical protein